MTAVELVKSCILSVLVLLALSLGPAASSIVLGILGPLLPEDNLLSPSYDLLATQSGKCKMHVSQMVELKLI